MIFAEEPKVVASWWADLLECPDDRVSLENGFVWFDVGDIEFGFHHSDGGRTLRAVVRSSICGSKIIRQQLLGPSPKVRVCTEDRLR